jgi:hypothetical protein|tara:strand:- start:466 stop:642 length:177 start_codon:yes stop_codon:yes gene_type:complete
MGVLAITVLPFAAFAGEGRYQAIVDNKHAGVYVVDTKTGDINCCTPAGGVLKCQKENK